MDFSLSYENYNQHDPNVSCFTEIRLISDPVYPVKVKNSILNSETNKYRIGNNDIKYIFQISTTISV